MSRGAMEIAREVFEQQCRDTDRLMRLIDTASDFVLPGTSAFDEDAHNADAPESHRLAYERAQAAALGAIAFLLLRRDEEMWSEWERY